jgi:hypothetical protein
MQTKRPLNGGFLSKENLQMGMAAFRINEEEREAREAEATEQAAECSVPAAEPESKKTTTVTAKKPVATAKG